jgi:prepilin-type processing-associated H-X9-DG protein
MDDPVTTPNALPEKRFQYRLSHLFIVTTVLAVVLAAFAQWGPDAIGPLIALSFISVGIYSLVRWDASLFVIGAIILLAALALLLPAVGSVRLGRRSQCASNLRQLAVALQEYEQVFGTYPPAYLADKNGKPMHSWRAIVYSNCDSEFKAGYRFDEPWDSPNNRKAAAKVGTRNLFSCPKEKSPSMLGETSYVAVVGPSTMFPGAKPVSEKDIKDGHTNTILLVEVHHSGIYWTEPRDFDVQQVVGSKSGRGISSPHGAGANVAMADGSTRYLEIKSLTPALIRALLTIDGGEDATIP